MFEDITKDSELLVASLAMLISFISILLGFFSLKIQRTHNRKSVKPLGNIVLSDYLNHIAIDIENNGVGPLVIEDVIVQNEGGKTANNVIDLMPETPVDLHWTNFAGGLTGFVITPGKDLNLLELKGDDSSQVFTDFRDSVRTELKSITIKLTYKDIYDQSMPATERKLSWFGRHEENTEE